MHDKLQCATVAETQQLGYSLAEQCYCIYCWNSNTHTHTQTPCDCAWHKSPTKKKKETVPQKICQQSQSVTATSMYSTYITHTHIYRICTQVSDLNAAHIYACLRACVWVRVSMCLRYLFAAILLFVAAFCVCRSLWLLSPPPPPPLAPPPPHRSRALCLTRFPYSDTVYFVFVIIFSVHFITMYVRHNRRAHHKIGQSARAICSERALVYDEWEQEGGKWEVNWGEASCK